MPDSLTTTPELAFVCDCELLSRTACAKEPFYKEHEGKSYCVLHLPETDKCAGFGQALKRKLDRSDFDFAGVWFPNEVMFRQFEFPANANFSCAKFSAKADFSSAIFNKKANFQAAIFVPR